MRLDHLKPFAKHLGFTPEQILLWGRYPGTMPDDHIELSDILGAHRERGEPVGPPRGQIPELDTRAGHGGGGVPAREVLKDGRHADPLKGEDGCFQPVSCASSFTPAVAAFRARHHRRQHGANHPVRRTSGR